ncbi:Hypothetical protein D9617_171g078110 [Elsinoe fawcettii]|nr:Hypothetical protein D9617_171g078110 [Elsinoe fawcettii]
MAGLTRRWLAVVLTMASVIAIMFAMRIVFLILYRFKWRREELQRRSHFRALIEAKRLSKADKDAEAWDVGKQPSSDAGQSPTNVFITTSTPTWKTSMEGPAEHRHDQIAAIPQEISLPPPALARSNGRKGGEDKSQVRSVSWKDETPHGPHDSQS